jgi:NitT/TauT family transport system ATP-binding protein
MTAAPGQDVTLPVVARNLSFAFRQAAAHSDVGELRVLQQINFELRRGELLTIIGPSGCGKTTLLRLVAGLADPAGATGLLEVVGRSVAAPSAEISYVFQQTALIPWRKVLANVEFAIELRRHRRLTKEEHKEVRRVIEFVGLAGFEHYYPYQLSGGMQQRVGIARALVVNPQILLMDEPFGALDAQSRRLFQDELLRWKSDGFSVILVTHDLDEAVYLSDRILVMSARPGRILEEIEVDLPPREDSQDVRKLRRYVDIHEHLWELLRPENLRVTGLPADPREKEPR